MRSGSLGEGSIADDVAEGLSDGRSVSNRFHATKTVGMVIGPVEGRNDAEGGGLYIPLCLVLLEDFPGRRQRYWRARRGKLTVWYGLG